MQRKYYRLNQQIQAKEVRLLDDKGLQIGIFSKEEALKKAQEEGVDLVEIAPTASPPVCKLVNFKKFLYQEEKKQREEKKKAKRAETKQIRFGPFTSKHDLAVKIEKTKEFLRHGNKVKIVVKFLGRQMAHPEFGQKTMNHFLEELSSVSKVEREPHFEGRFLIVSITPVRHKG